MDKYNYIFDVEQRHLWERTKQVLWPIMKGVFTSSESFQIIIEPWRKGKSYEQLKGYYRLINKILPVLKKDNPDHYFDKDVVDDVIKDKYKYYTEYEGVKSYKSKSNATIEDMTGLIKTAEAIGEILNIKDCYLTSDEERALKEFYE